MKKIFAIVAAMLVALVANAAVININTGTADALRNALNTASTGDVIVMAAGTYVESPSNYIYFIGKEVKVMAEEGAEVIVVPKVPIRFKEGARAEFDNIKFDCGHLSDVNAYSEMIVPADDTPNKRVILRGCEFYGWTQDNAIIHATSSRRLDSVIIDNCYFHNNVKSCVFMENPNLIGLEITNTTFADVTTASGYSAGVVDVRATSGSVLIDHCTFYNCEVKNTDYGAVKIPNAIAPTVSNCIFMMPEAYAGGRAIYNADGAVNNCLTYNYSKDDGTGIHSGPAIAACVQADPLFRNAANGDLHLRDNSPAYGAGTDGSALGDPRWIPTMDYYLVGSMNEWAVDPAYKLKKNEANDGEYMIDRTLFWGDEFKIVKSDGAEIATWYPDGMGNNFVVSASGDYTVYFRPDGQGGEGWHEGFIYTALKDLGPWEAMFFDELLNPAYDSYISYDAAAGKVTIHIREELYPASTTVQSKALVPEEGKCYRVSLKMKANRDITGISLIWSHGTRKMLEENESISLEENNIYFYEAVCAGMFDPASLEGSTLYFGLSFVSPGDEIEIFDVAIEETDCPEPPTYYLVGSMTEWAAEEAYKFEANEAAEGEYMLNICLPEGAGIKVVGISEGNETWYPGGIGNEYIVDAAHAGWGMVYFRPAGNPAWDAFGGYMYIATGEGIDQVETAAQTVKFIENGQLFVRKNGIVYTVLGETVK